MSQRQDIHPYEISFNPDNLMFYVHDSRREDEPGVAVVKSNGKPAIFRSWSGAVACAKRLIADSGRGRLA